VKEEMALKGGKSISRAGERGDRSPGGDGSSICSSVDEERELEEPKMKDVQIIYKGNDPHADKFRHNLQELIDHAVELILNKLPHPYSEDGLPSICVEHCPEEVRHKEKMGDLRCLKVYVEGYGPCVVMVY
jgi:hypothetical protein